MNSADAVETRTVAKVSRRFLPLLIVCYFTAYLDRVNVSFAALTMKPDLGLSAAAYGFGAGIFFLAYFLFEVPSNLLLVRFGARRWIARIMFTWGVLSAGMAFVTGTASFYVLRFLLGLAEAGFFPGIIFFLTLWFPAAHRARIMGYFMAAIPLSSVIGAPLSGLVLGLDGLLGMKGWQWLFIVEALPALLLAVVVFRHLTDRPEEATWLDTEERDWLVRRLAVEHAHSEQHGLSLLRALGSPKVLALSAIYFGVVATLYGLAFFLPQIVQGFGFGMSNLKIGLVSALPYLVGTLSIVLWSRRSDRRRERRFHVAFPLAVAAFGTAAAAIFQEPALKMLAFCVAGFGVFGAMPVFWTLPTAFLSGTAAAGGIAMINSIGNLAGFAAPYAMGYLKDATGSYTSGLLSLAATGIAAMVVVLTLEKPPPPVPDA